MVQKSRKVWPKLDYLQQCKTHSERCKVENMMLTCCQDHILTENIWFLWSKTSYEGDKWRCDHGDKQPESENRANQQIDNGLLTFAITGSCFLSCPSGLSRKKLWVFLMINRSKCPCWLFSEHWSRVGKKETWPGSTLRGKDTPLQPRSRCQANRAEYQPPFIMTVTLMVMHV